MAHKSLALAVEDQVAAGQDFLTVHLNTLLKEWVDSRRPQEEVFRQNYMDRMRISRPDDTSGTGTPTSRKARPLFMGQTRSKIRTARSRIKDALFGQGRLPFDTSPKKEELKKEADAFEKIIRAQLRAMKYKREMSGGINAICTYGTGFIVGPFTREKTQTTVSRQTDDSGIESLEQIEHTFKEPFYEHARTINVFPDPESKDTQEGRGVFWFNLKTAAFIRTLLDNSQFQHIAVALQEQESFQQEGKGQRLLETARANIQYFTKDGRISYIHFFGLLPEAGVEAWERGELQPFSTEFRDPKTKWIETWATIAGGIVVRVRRNPHEHRMLRRCVYEDEDDEMYGVGIASNNEPNQRVMNASFRLFVESKGFSLLGVWMIDRSKFAPKEDFKLFPGKVYELASGVTVDESEAAIRQITFEDVSDGWVDAISLSEKFSDEDTGITRSSQGTQESALLRAPARAIELLQNVSNVPLKEVMDNIDDMWIGHHIDELIHWDLEFLTPETVEVLHDKETAETWRVIQEFGKPSFMTWQPVGAQTFVAKQITAQKLQAFTALVLGSDKAQQDVDTRELLDQVWENLEIGKESPVFDQDTADQNAEAQREAQEKAEALETGKIKAETGARRAETMKKVTDSKIAQREALAGEGDNAELKALIREVLARLPEAGENQRTQRSRRRR